MCRLTSLCLLSCLLGFTYTANAQDTTAQEEPESVATETSPSVKYSCANGGMVRRVEVVYESATATVPCSVNYYKDSEAPGQTATLWRADSMAGYCEAKASEFAEKLRSWGWACTDA